MKGIIFSAEMVKAILDGSKTQTRQLHGLEMINQNPDAWELLIGSSLPIKGRFTFCNKKTGSIEIAKCPYGGVGDGLYIKETWAVDNLWDNKKPSEISPYSAVWYATEAKGLWVGKIRSPLFMPKWASRLRFLLKVAWIGSP